MFCIVKFCNFAEFLETIRMESKENYIIPLKELPIGEHSYEFHLKDDYFQWIDTTEIHRGDVNVKIALRKSDHSTELKVFSKGVVFVPCDRCMEDVQVEVDSEDRLIIKFGDSYEEVDETLVTIPEIPGEIDLSWFMYEFIALNVPIRHVHPDGECVGSIAEHLDTYMTIERPNDAEVSEEEGTKEVDPRWAGLKDLLDNGFPGEKK